MMLEVQKRHFVPKIWNFLQLHDLVVIIFCLLSQCLRKNHYYVRIRILKVENSCDLRIQELSVQNFPIKTFIRYVDLVVFFALN